MARSRPSRYAAAAVLTSLLGFFAIPASAGPTQDMVRQFLEPEAPKSSAQVLRDTIGRECVSHIRSSDIGWSISHSGDKGVYPICECAVEASLRRNVGSQDLMPSLSIQHRMLNTRGVEIVRAQTERCARITVPDDAPRFREAWQPEKKSW